jgi:hypothetical protein
MRSFETWTYEEVENVFGLTMHRTGPLFQEWLDAAACDPDDATLQTLDQLRDLLFEEALNWNEDELKLFFIGPVLGLIKFKTPYFKPFTQRSLTAKYNGHSSSGKVDFLLAKGKVIPQNPYFCLHEYKQENRRENDPLGQLLIGMVAAQQKNEGNHPIFGTYVSGRNWFFIMLDGKNYYLSDAYVASSNDLYRIYAILKKCRLLAEGMAIQEEEHAKKKGEKKMGE